MKRLRAWMVLFAMALGWAAGAAPVPLSVAAAGDLRGTLEEVKAGFEARNPGVQVQISFGPSGGLTAQIQQGAPFDVFLSADTGFPETLQQAGLGAPEGSFPYATGHLVLWVRKDLGLDPASGGLRTLQAASIRKVATANPRLAPYGRAGEAALRRAGLYETLQSKLVFADNIAQAAQFLQAGSAEAGLISAAQAGQPALSGNGRAWTVPEGSHPPLKQAGLILKRTPHGEAARAFRAFLLGAEGQAILARHGFGRP